MRVKPVKLLIAFVALLIVLQAWRISRDAGIFVRIEDIEYGACERLPGPPGAEDINIDPVNGVAFLSASNGRAIADHMFHDGPAPASGDIWLLDMTLPDSQPVPLQVELDHPFHPHGIDLHINGAGERELYVINHPTRTDHEVLIFSINGEHQLSLKRQITYPELISPNDLVALGRDRFFATNDHGSNRGTFMHSLEDYLGLSRSSVSYYDGETGGLLLGGLKSANGITMSQDKQSLYVAEALGRKVKRYQRGNTFTQWTLLETLSLDTMADNLIWENENHLILGAHPKAFPFLAYVKDATKLSPSHIVRIDVSSRPMQYETIFMSDGSDISASSVGAMWNRELLIGSVLDPFILRCRQ